MSFSGEIKDEIARQMPEQKHCILAEIAAIIQFSGSVCTEPGKEEILVETENVGLARKYLRLIKQAFQLQTELQIRDMSGGKAHQYSICIGIASDVEQVLQETTESVAASLSDESSTRLCCLRSFLRGAFLAAGSMSNPGKSYHFEIICRTRQTVDMLQRMMERFGIRAKITERKNRQVLYLKDSTGIVDILNVIGAHQSLMELENIRIIKNMRNCANRQYNCDSANINKMVHAATRQLEDIHLIEKYMGFENLSPTLQEMARVRLEHPDVSLQELGTCLDPPVGKSGVNHRLRKLGEIAANLRAEQEKNHG